MVADSLIHKENGIIFALLLNGGLQIVEVLLTPGNGGMYQGTLIFLAISINQISMTLTDEPGERITWIDEYNLAFTASNGHELFLFCKNEQDVMFFNQLTFSHGALKTASIASRYLVSLKFKIYIRSLTKQY